MSLKHPDKNILTEIQSMIYERILKLDYNAYSDIILFDPHSFDFITAPLVHPRYKREFFRWCPERPGPLTRSDMVLSSEDWTSVIVSKLSSWIRLDSEEEIFRKNSEKVRDEFD